MNTKLGNKAHQDLIKILDLNGNKIVFEILNGKTVYDYNNTLGLKFVESSFQEYEYEINFNMSGITIFINSTVSEYSVDYFPLKDGADIISTKYNDRVTVFKSALAMHKMYIEIKDAVKAMFDGELS